METEFVLYVGERVDDTGLLFTALTRVRIPNDLLVGDEFPAKHTIDKPRSNPGFQQRLDRESKQEVAFARTLRHRQPPGAIYVSTNRGRMIKQWMHKKSSSSFHVRVEGNRIYVTLRLSENAWLLIMCTRMCSEA